MFGYVRPILDRLSEEDKLRYKSVYCGLCHEMGRRHGWLARFTLNYDFTFLAVLLCGAEGETATCLARCPAHPLKPPRQCVCGGSLALAADESLILTWHKLSDDVADKSFFAGLPARVLRSLLKKAYIRAAGQCPEFDLHTSNQLAELSRLEGERSPQLDRTADTFARILSAAAGQSADPAQQRTLEQLLYHLGRWIYLLDAWDDLEEDEKQGRYNPLSARFEGQALREREYIETTVTHSARLVESAANLMDFGMWSGITENVICVGLSAVQKAVFDGRWKELRKVREQHK